MLAGMMNSVAGGGTLLTFPALIWLGLAPINANATSTVALWPGLLGAIWGYRRELRQAEGRFFALIVPSIIGGLAGAVLLKRTPQSTFAALVPFLILFATILFMFQETVQRWLRSLELNSELRTPNSEPVTSTFEVFPARWADQERRAQGADRTQGPPDRR